MATLLSASKFLTFSDYMDILKNCSEVLKFTPLELNKHYLDKGAINKKVYNLAKKQLLNN